MLTVKLVTISMVLEDLCFLLLRFLPLRFLPHPPPVYPYFSPSIFVFTHPNDGWTGLYIKLCSELAYRRYRSVSITINRVHRRDPRNSPAWMHTFVLNTGPRIKMNPVLRLLFS